MLQEVYIYNKDDVIRQIKLKTYTIEQTKKLDTFS